MKQKKLLIFDVYGTLISTGNGSIEAVRKILALQDKEIDAKEFYSVWKRFHRLHMDKANEGNFVTEEEIFVQDLKRLYEDYGIGRDYNSDVKFMLDSLVGRVTFEDSKETLNKLRENAVFIGDSLVDDVYGPRQAGLKTVLIDRAKKYDKDKSEIVPDYVVDDLRNLIELEL